MYNKEYYENNREKLLAGMKKWREANPEKVAAAQRDWRERNEGRLYTEKATGYVFCIGYNHPIANASGVTAHHRMILWDKLEGKDANCHWCPKVVSWSKTWPQDADALVTDHLNGIKDDNRPENLVPACASCNTKRASTGRPGKDWGNCQAAWEDGQCDRKASVHANDLEVCKAHYQQAGAGREFAPIVAKVFSADTSGRECNECHTFKTWDNYYAYGRGGYFSKCKACVREQQAARNAARQVAA